MKSLSLLVITLSLSGLTYADDYCAKAHHHYCTQRNIQNLTGENAAVGGTTNVGGATSPIAAGKNGSWYPYADHPCQEGTTKQTQTTVQYAFGTNTCTFYLTIICDANKNISLGPDTASCAKNTATFDQSNATWIVK